MQNGRRSKEMFLWIYTSVLLLTLSVVLNFDFFNEFHPGGSNSTMATPVGPPSFSILKKMFPSTLTPEKFADTFDLLKAQIAGDYGQGETIGFIEVDGEYSQKSFHEFNRQFEGQMSELSSPVKVTVLPKAENLGVHSKEQIDETMTDVEWAHVVAPKANLVVFDSSKMSKEQISQAISKYHVNVLSESILDSKVFNHVRDPFIRSHQAGILSLSMSHPFFTGTGDGGANVAPAAMYPDAVLVGGIEVPSRNPIQVWNFEGYGSAVGMQIAPRYERSITHNFWRTVPDVLWMSGPPGVSTETPLGWLPMSGTSLGGPIWAALWSLGDNLHRHNMGSPLSSNANATLYKLYKKYPNAFIHPRDNSLPTEATGLGYPNSYQIVKDLGKFQGRVTPGSSFKLQRVPFYLAFIEFALAILFALLGRSFKASRRKAVLIVTANSVLAFCVMIVISTLCSAIEANDLIRDIAFFFMVIPYLFLIRRFDKWVWNTSRWK
ncbi:hypothetical protein [Alicyclobacillus sp. SO9]|uniref:hypothetical protein n=1 Tax=Alicyclobacillus sp. SO9 TaxID=2665646 RepID=UPI0018E8C42D|nr:hypothetical protein [Alicyclobacillus sp. SO9]QQE80160.1 hypothetical protein GI364_06930 [Alicyclobacillus sp. SO9]